MSLRESRAKDTGAANVTDDTYSIPVSGSAAPPCQLAPPVGEGSVIAVIGGPTEIALLAHIGHGILRLIPGNVDEGERLAYRQSHSPT